MPTNNLDGIKAYLIRAVLFTYFQSGTTSKLQQIKSNINNNEYEITVDMLEQMSDLRVTDGKIDDIINSEKDPFFYSVTKGNIDYSYIEGIVE